MADGAKKAGSEKPTVEQQFTVLLSERPMVCRVGLFVALAVVGYFVVLDPGVTSIEGTKAKIKAAIDTAKSIATADAASAVLKNHAARLPAWTSNYEWMERFLDAAREHDVRLVNLQPNVAAKSWLVETEQVDIDLQLIGAYPRIAAFIAWRERERPFHRVVGVNLSKKADGALVCGLKLKVMQRKGDGSA